MFGADNQQERPGFEQWIVGFVDGEGCFSVPIFRQRTARLGWQVQPEFAVVQAARSVRVLWELQRYFDCGQVRTQQRAETHREPISRWSVRSFADLTGRIAPFFERYPLRTAKADEFASFRRVLVAQRSEGSDVTFGALCRSVGTTCSRV